MNERETEVAGAATAAKGDAELLITRFLDAPPELVFRVWTEPEHLVRWCGPRGFTVTSSEGELHPGGAWRSTMVAPDGETYRVGGVYREVVAGERLVFTHAWEGEDGAPGHETLVAVTFAGRGSGTEMTFRQAGFRSVESRDGHAEGWNETFDRLEHHVREDAGADAATTDREVVVTRTFDAPRPLVFDAWTRPEHAVHWYGAAGYTTPVCEMDVRTGGAFRICMRSPEGVDCWERGVFREVIVPARIVSVYTATLGDGPGVELTTEVSFEEVDGHTLLTVRQTFSEADFTRGAAQGTQEALDRLAAYLHQLATPTTGATA